MGNHFTVDMEENYKKNQDFITEMNTVKVCVVVCKGWCSVFTNLIGRAAVANAKSDEREASGFGDS